ncbi:hypothetical protein [Streptomyces sp. NPDC050988]|uniref:hypothetical protein n=1 Tax=Streptomyces sp. NPDC050988 TaxID=3365637 RepID=UPI0037B6A8E7
MAPRPTACVRGKLPWRLRRAGGAGGAVEIERLWSEPAGLWWAMETRPLIGQARGKVIALGQ